MTICTAKVSAQRIWGIFNRMPLLSARRAKFFVRPKNCLSVPLCVIVMALKREHILVKLANVEPNTLLLLQNYPRTICLQIWKILFVFFLSMIYLESEPVTKSSIKLVSNLLHLKNHHERGCPLSTMLEVEITKCVYLSNTAENNENKLLKYHKLFKYLADMCKARGCSPIIH